MNRLLSTRKSAVRSVAAVPGSARCRRLAMFVSLKKVSMSIFNPVPCLRGGLNRRSTTLPTIHVCAAKPLSSCDRGSHPKIRLTSRPHAAWRVRNRVVLFAIGGLRRAGTTAEAECFEMLRIADRPAAHAGPQLHEFDGNQHRCGMIARFPTDYRVRSGLLPTAEFAIGCGSFSRLLGFRHLKSIESFLNYLATIALFSGPDCP